MVTSARAIRGTDNPACRVSDGQVAWVRSEWAAGRTQSSIADELGVSAAQVCRIVNGRRRGPSHLPASLPPGNVREVIGWPGYMVSDEGVVYSCRTNGGMHIGRWKKLAARPNKEGYPQVGLWNHCQKRLRRVHTLVLEAFVGPSPDGMQGCHRDGNPANNRLDNLRWDTPQANIDDRGAHGTTARGERSGVAKLTADQVIAIRLQRAAGVPRRAVAVAFGISESQVKRINNGTFWKHIEAPRDVPIFRDELVRAGKVTRAATGGQKP